MTCADKRNRDGKTGDGAPAIAGDEVAEETGGAVSRDESSDECPWGLE